jgi:hypothetical protein
MTNSAYMSGDAGGDLKSDLAQVNLLRIRGDISSAKTLCLSVLKRHPDSVDAHVMMGDLHAEQADLKPALEWYSLALDMDPNAPGVAVKQTRVQAALEISSQAHHNKGLILAGKKQSPWMYAAIAAAAIAIGIISYTVGKESPKASVKPTSSIQENIVAPPAQKLQIGSNEQARPNNLTTPADPSVDRDSSPINIKTSAVDKGNEGKNDSGSVAVDEILLEQIRDRTPFKRNLVSVIADPRDNSLIVTFNVTEGEHGRYTGAMLADTAMEYESKVAKVTLRGVRNGILMYMADVERSAILAVESENGSDVKDLSDHTWIDRVLTNEFFKNGRVTTD